MEKRNDAAVLEMALRSWEDLMYMNQVQLLKAGGQPSGPTKHWSSFRDYLLHYRHDQPFDREKFVSNDPDGQLVHIPAVVAAWVSHSKRIFRLSKDMQSRFSVIKLGNMRVSDVLMPFPAFGIQFDTPIQSGYDRFALNFMLVSNYHELLVELPIEQKGRAIGLTSFPQSQAEYQAFDHREKMEALSLIGKPGKERQLQKILKRQFAQFKQVTEKIGGLGTDGLIIGTNKQDMLVEDYLSDIAEEVSNVAGSETMVVQIRIIFNLCLYLQSLPPEAKSQEGAKWEREVSDKLISPRPVITAETEVCDIIGRHILDSMIVDKRPVEHRAGGWEVIPHWRRAHKRRPPGQGHDPNAEKTVKIPHVLVREDRVPEVGVVKGSIGDVVR